MAEAQAAVDREVDLPLGWTVDWGGQFENLQEATARLATLIPLALLMIFVLLCSTFGSARLGTMIFLNIPIAATGGVFGLRRRRGRSS